MQRTIVKDASRLPFVRMWEGDTALSPERFGEECRSREDVEVYAYDVEDEPSLFGGRHRRTRVFCLKPGDLETFGSADAPHPAEAVDPRTLAGEWVPERSTGRPSPDRTGDSESRPAKSEEGS